MEFHGTSQLVIVIPWNSMEFGYLAKFHGTFKIPWNSMELGVAIPRNSMEFGVGIKFHGNFKVLWNAMELPFWRGKVPWNFMEFHGTSGEFHGIPWNCEILILIHFIIGEVYFIVCCMISCHCISDNPLVVEILRYFNSKASFWCPSFRLNGGIPF